MVFPFGVSVADFFAGVKLIKTSIDAFSSTRGAHADYAELARSIGSLERALGAASVVVLDTQPRCDAVKRTVDDCQTCIAEFLAGIEQFKHLNNDSRRSARKFTEGLQKIQWATCKKEYVMAFRAKVEMHVSALDMLLLSFQVERLMRLNASADSTNRIVLGIENSVKDQGTMTQTALTQYSNRLNSLEQEVTSQSSVAASNSCTLQQIGQKLQSALSPEDQKLILHLLQETLKKNEELKSQMEDLKCQNQCLERHMLGIKATIQLQRNVPPQVMLQQPVILKDAIGRIAPFHLEFINSAAALKAVLKIRFRHVGLQKIMANEYGFRDSNRQTSIDLSKAWESNFLPGQHIEMSMWYPDDGSNNCPGCGFQDASHFDEGVQAKCPQCPMIYCRTKLPILFQELKERRNATLEDEYRPEPMSSFCRVDLIQKDKTDSIFWGGGSAGSCVSGADGSWYCGQCGDGPYGGWNPTCNICGARRS